MPSASQLAHNTRDPLMPVWREIPGAIAGYGDNRQRQLEQYVLPQRPGRMWPAILPCCAARILPPDDGEDVILGPAIGWQQRGGTAVVALSRTAVLIFLCWHIFACLCIS